MRRKSKVLRRYSLTKEALEPSWPAMLASVFVELAPRGSGNEATRSAALRWDHPTVDVGPVSPDDFRHRVDAPPKRTVLCGCLDEAVGRVEVFPLAHAGNVAETASCCQATLG